ncbi:MAG: hypothetical protein M1561_01010 [Gammaproteobacteria bacterium]|nr:hypothetical protein [Gammaproteobacteria bacterium]
MKKTMLKARKLFILLCGLSCLLLVSGCFSVKHIDRKQYLLDVKNFPAKKAPKCACILEINQLTATPPFDQLSFIYRISDTQYITDFYHSFLVAPTQQLSGLLTNRLYATGHIKQLAFTSSHYKLYPKLTKFYADYRDRNHPKAIIAMQIMLSKETKSTQAILLDKNFIVQVPIQEKNSDCLLAAWNKGVATILAAETKAITTALAKAGC